MKLFLTTLLFACASVVLAQGIDPTAPPKLAALQAQYQAAIAADAKIIRTRYLQHLQQLETDALSTKDFDLAAAVGREIALLSKDNSSKGATAPVNPDSTEIEERLINTTWVWYENQTITFLADGRARWSYNGDISFTWKVVGTNPAVIEGTGWNGKKYRITLNDSLRTGSLREGWYGPRTTNEVNLQ